ncbi:hypothetical protein Taro_007579 [Colocasia esculenta]|uniref:Uncharacterized protein n=1 Tax=Colocasia esculenta TaxID=4460 RepID=A0A843U0R5_COLES|nr:hypothetical protein [Colocasia esculenta]
MEAPTGRWPSAMACSMPAREWIQQDMRFSIPRGLQLGPCDGKDGSSSGCGGGVAQARAPADRKQRLRDPNVGGCPVARET